jgi:chondroitin-sulfate-ABC endolyase/exolyase
MKRLFTTAMLLCGFFCAGAQQRFADFESGVPSYFSTTGTTSLTTTAEHVKSGSNALKWSAAKGDKIIATNLNISSSEVGSSTASSAQLYVYSPAVSNDTLLFEFLDNSGVVKRTGRMLLNFAGWRDYHRSYIYDYNVSNNMPAFLLNQCRITYKQVAGGSGLKTLFFDNFTFIGNTEARQPGPHMALDYQNFKQDLGEDPLGAYLKKSNVTIGTASSTELSSLQTVKAIYKRNIGSVNATAVTAAKTYVNNCGISRNGDGTIKGRGILATNNKDTLVLISTHIQSLARAANANDIDAKSKLLLFTEYIIDQGVSEGGRNDLATNDYTNTRTFPVGFLEALSLYPEPLRTDVINLLKWSHEYNKIYETNPVPGQNTDFVHIKLTFLFETACSLTSLDESVSDLKYLKNFLEFNALVSQGFRDGVKPDGTGFHHQSHHLSYMYAFGTWADRAYSLKGTVFKISQLAYDNMVFAYKSIFLESSQGGVTANSESGRTPFPAAVTVNQTQFRRLVEVGGDIIGASFEPNLAAFYNYTYKVNYYGVTAGDYDGFYASNYANLGVKKSNTWTAVMKGVTSYLFGSEIYPTQNRYGRYQAYGALEILYNGTLDNSGYVLNGAGWDWNYMPGATTVVLPFNKLQAAQSRADEYQVNDFAGALSLGKNGIFGIDFLQRNTTYYTTSNLKFKKSVFAFDNLLICLGSDISVTNNQGSVVSNLFQTVNTTATPTMYVKSTTPITGAFSSSYPLASAYSWLTSSQGTGFYLPQGNNDYRIELGTQTTPNYTSLTGAETSTANFTRAYLVHGNQPLSTLPAKYEYVVAPAVTPTDMQTLAQTLASGSVYTVLNQDADFHAIKYIPDNSTAYVFFKPKTLVTVGLIQSVSQPSIINIKEYDTDKVLVTINSPDLNAVSDPVSDFISSPLLINLGLTGTYTIISNPNNASVSQLANQLTVGFTVKDGFSNTILLQKTTLTPIKLLNFDGAYKNSAIELNWASAEEKNVNHFMIYSSTDGANFKEIAQVSAIGNSSTLQKYNYLDKNFDATVNTMYYKLQSIDNDGTISSEKVTAVKIPFNGNKVSFYPNPVNSFINVSLNADKQELGTIQIYTLNGIMVYKKEVVVKQGFNLFPIVLESLNTGEYIIKLSTGGTNSTQKFIKL